MVRHRKKIIALALLVFGVISYQAFKYSPFNKMEYKPFCYDNGKKYLDGPLRPEFKEHVIGLLREQNFRIWEENDNLYVTLIQIDEGNEVSVSRAEYLRNMEGKIIRGIWDGSRTVIEFIPASIIMQPPSVLVTAVKEVETEKGKNPGKSWAHWPHWDDCKIKRAGAIWVEKLDGQDASQNP